ncbi:MAG: DNA repair protein RadA [Oscillatoriaceae bacterium SKW80]|nr:DNA repair protein RadA [Oscillatoriaceae bacterium SKYG93]MCX8121138.1 DNA repair protein RadA [Oscillatoriaceae bacterium SKW80]MDW8453532.1 DNA repair protein RadA [Oscillatoriaceae cyanobacterium SKYGB_i_bin93]HIK26883.1 DNA repair protein RadA [Oscillatoriaceae cyanobacterium M7585_C2015_266]
MPKPRIHYICNECGAEFPQYYGRCPNCQTWNSLIEQQLSPAQRNPVSLKNRFSIDGRALLGETTTGQPRSSLKLSQIADIAVNRLSSGFGEMDRVLGGGIVPGSLILIGGEPGIGKSTLLLQVANQLSYNSRVLYVSGEESGQQVKLRAQRLQVAAAMTTDKGEKVANQKISPAESNFFLLAETNLEEILRELESLKPNLAVIDSIQTIFFPSLSSAPGSVAQVRECTSALMQVAKRENITLFIVGHVTKDGMIAGPRVLEHLVDTVLFFEGDRFASHRLLRSMKNRFGATHEIGVFEMIANGLREVENPSELFLGSREEMVSGSAIIVACEGTRPLVVELQALVSPSSYGSPRRATTGVESNRLLQILAVLEKRLGVPLSKLDTYVASVGGLTVSEPAADLGIAIAVVASFRDRIVDPHTVIIGEVGLGGQVRAVSQLELRLREAAKLGFKRAIIPKGQIPPDLGMTIIPVGKVLDAIIEAIPSQPTSYSEFDISDFDYEPEEEELLLQPHEPFSQTELAKDKDLF